MKLKSESADDYKEYILEQIKFSRFMIGVWNWLIGKSSDYANVGYTIISKEQAEIAEQMNELIRNEKDGR